MATLSRNLKLHPKWTIQEQEESRKKHRLTKILCTIGPKTNSYEGLQRLIEGGMDVAWLNLAHGSHQFHTDIINHLSVALKDSTKKIAIVAETKGPKIRTGNLKNGSANLVAGSEVVVSTDSSLVGDETKIVVDFPNLCAVVKEKIMVDYGQLVLTPKSIDLLKKEVTCIVENSWTLGENKVVHLPGAVFNLPAVSVKDRDDILFALSKGIDIICAPIRTPWNIQQLKDVMREEGRNVRILAKIESTEGIDNFDMILKSCDGIVISRGDLGVELPMEQVFKAQKMMISKCTADSKPVVVSSQMLESMIKNPRPTRAEATDVANAVLDGAECVMLSGETSVGDYPHEALKYMSGMCIEAENVEAVSDYPSLFEALKAQTKAKKIPEVVSSYCVRAANDIKAKALIVLSETGNTTRLVSKYRPRVPVICVTPAETAAHFLCLTRGVIPLVMKHDAKIHDSKLVADAMEYCRKIGLASTGDKIVIVQGVVEGVSGQSNSFKILDCP